MNFEVTALVKKKFDNKIIKFGTIGFIILLLLGGAFGIYYFKNQILKSSTTQSKTAKATKGDISVTVSGSGAVAYVDSRDITSKVKGTVSKVYHQEGDIVEKGDVLFELDKTDAEISIKKSSNSVAQAKMALDNNSASIAQLNVVAPFDGFVSDIKIKKEDKLNEGSEVLTLTDTSKLKLNLPFNSEVSKSIYVGQDAKIYIEDFMQTVIGKVSYVSDKPYTTSNGGELDDIEFTISNPGSLKDGMKAHAEVKIDSVYESSVEGGMLEFINCQSVKSQTTGSVNNILVKSNQYVEKGQVLVYLENKDLMDSKTTNTLKLNELSADLKQEEDQLADYTIVAPIDGVVVTQSIKGGEQVNQGQVLGVVASNKEMKFNVDVDELDIAKIEKDQTVNVSVSAVPETIKKKLLGKVSKVAVEGNSSNGVTTYPVTITLVAENDKLKAGMNADAEIVVESKKNVLLLPIEAIQKEGDRAYVLVKSTDKKTGTTNQTNGNRVYNSMGNTQNKSAFSGNSTTRNVTKGTTSYTNGNAANNNDISGTVRRLVTLGISNETYYEIIQGVQQGEEVVLPTSVQQTQQSTSQNSRLQGAGGIMGRRG